MDAPLFTPKRTGSTGKLSRHHGKARSNSASRTTFPRSLARSTRCQPHRRGTRTETRRVLGSPVVDELASKHGDEHDADTIHGAGWQGAHQVLTALAARYTGDTVRGWDVWMV